MATEADSIDMWRLLALVAKKLQCPDAERWRAQVGQTVAYETPSQSSDTEAKWQLGEIIAIDNAMVRVRPLVPRKASAGDATPPARQPSPCPTNDPCSSPPSKSPCLSPSKSIALEESRARVAELREKLAQRRRCEAIHLARLEVRRIDAREISEIQSYRTPPRAVRVVMEAVLIVLGQPLSANVWANTQAAIRQPNFLQQVLELRPGSLSEPVLTTLRNRYLRDPLFEEEALRKASHASCSLRHWVLAHVNYRPEDVEAELSAGEASQMEAEMEALEKEIAELTGSQAVCGATPVTPSWSPRYGRLPSRSLPSATPLGTNGRRSETPLYQSIRKRVTPLQVRAVQSPSLGASGPNRTLQREAEPQWVPRAFIVLVLGKAATEESLAATPEGELIALLASRTRPELLQYLCQQLEAEREGSTSHTGKMNGDMNVARSDAGAASPPSSYSSANAPVTRQLFEEVEIAASQKKQRELDAYVAATECQMDTLRSNVREAQEERDQLAASLASQEKQLVAVAAERQRERAEMENTMSTLKLELAEQKAAVAAASQALDDAAAREQESRLKLLEVAAHPPSADAVSAGRADGSVDVLANCSDMAALQQKQHELDEYVAATECKLEVLRSAAHESQEERDQLAASLASEQERLRVVSAERQKERAVGDSTIESLRVQLDHANKLRLAAASREEMVLEKARDIVTAVQQEYLMMPHTDSQWRAEVAALREKVSLYEQDRWDEQVRAANTLDLDDTQFNQKRKLSTLELELELAEKRVKALQNQLLLQQTRKH